MLYTNAIFSQKQDRFEHEMCAVKKVIRLSGSEYDYFARNMLRDQGFIKDNVDLMVFEDGARGCLLVVGEGRRDGILVDSSGYDYARYSAFIPNAEALLTVGQYPALASLNKKLTDIADHIVGQTGERAVVDLEDLKAQFDIDLMGNDSLINTILGMLEEKPEIKELELDKNELIIYREPEATAQTAENTLDTPGTQERRAPIEAFIVNQDRHENGELIGEWLAFPTTPEALGELFTRIGIAGPYDEGYIVYDFRSPYYGVATALQKNDSLDDLNMLTEYMDGMEDWELGKMQASLKLDIDSLDNGAAHLINMLDANNFDEFSVIDASDEEELGRYWEEEDPNSYPEGVPYAEYGRQLVAEEKGVFTEWGYIYFGNKELSQQYDGIVPHEFRILDKALLDAARHSAPPKDASCERDEKPSVVEQIKAARQASHVPTDKDEKKPKKDKGGPEL